MRRGYDSEILTDEQGEFVGINLGADFTSEHEWGIKGIRNEFGVDTTKLGIEKRVVRKVPETLMFVELTDGSCVLIMDRYLYYGSNKKDIPKVILKSSELSFSPYRDQNTLVCAWDERSFGIRVKKEYEEQIKAMYNAFLEKDIAIWVGGGGVFQNGGLVIAIKSKIPQEAIKNMYEADIDQINLEKAAKKTGIHKILEKANKKYHALSPRWEDDDKKEVIFWLNPREQHLYNACWCEVEDLKEWTKNKGKIMKNK
ncbi:MAG: hypothetical protein WDA59_08910 [Methanofastidiosum sp.]|jgi:hypothetical protein